MMMASAILFLVSCKENTNILDFNSDQSYIYFAYPNPNTRAVEKYLDSIYYSFSLDEDLSVQEKTIAIPMQVAGLQIGSARNYELVIDESSDYDPAIVQLSEPVIGAGKYVDTLYVKIRRDQQLQSKEMNLVLRLMPNDHFRSGHLYNQRIKIRFSDILTEPTWWRVWSTFMGPFHKEVFQKWMQIYYLGVDPTPELYGNFPAPYYYWNEMPTSATQSWHPVTFMHIAVLKKYFQDHVVYPNGDTTQSRILLP